MIKELQVNYINAIINLIEDELKSINGVEDYEDIYLFKDELNFKLKTLQFKESFNQKDIIKLYEELIEKYSISKYRSQLNDLKNDIFNINEEFQLCMERNQYTLHLQYIGISSQLNIYENEILNDMDFTNSKIEYELIDEKFIKLNDILSKILDILSENQAYEEEGNQNFKDQIQYFSDILLEIYEIVSKYYARYNNELQKEKTNFINQIDENMKSSKEFKRIFNRKLSKI